MMKKPFSIFWLLLITVLFIVLLSSCSVFHWFQSLLPNRKPDPKTVIIGSVLGNKINPILAGTSSSVAIWGSIFDGLVRINEESELIPHLAEKWKYRPDYNELVIYLRQGVKFHDGVELTAEDVKFTYEAIMHPDIGSYLSSEFESVTRIEAEGKYRVRIYFKEPNANFLYTLRTYILPKHLLTFKDLTNPELAFNRHPIGTGAFKIVDWTSDALLLEANPDYFLGKPNIDRVIIRSIKNPTESWADLMTGKVEVMEDIMPEDYRILVTEPSLQGYKSTGLHYYMVALNNHHPLFSDVRIRKALNYAIDKQAIIDEVLLGEGVVCKSIFPVEFFPSEHPIQKEQYQPRVAEKLFRDAGWVKDKKTHLLMKDGVPFEFTLLIDKENTLKQQIALILDQQLQEFGINFHLKSVPIDELVENYLLPKKFDAHLPEMNSLYESNFGYVFYHSSQNQNGRNVHSYRNPKVDKLYDQLLVTVDPKPRKQIFVQLHRELVEDPPGIFLFYPYRLAGVNKKFVNIKPRSNENILWNLEEWDVKS
jgi:peptide/nickel transport system substrate-binding protein